MSDLDGHQSVGFTNLTSQELSSSAFSGSKGEGHREERTTAPSEKEGNRKEIVKRDLFGVGSSRRKLQRE